MIDKDRTERGFVDIFSDNSTKIEDEDINGDDETIEALDPTKLRISMRPMAVGRLCARMKDQKIDLFPDCQRKTGIWKANVQSRLIESMLVYIPLPAFYIDVTNDEKWLVIDGLQRLTTLKTFIVEKRLRLCGLEFLTHLEGKLYDELPLYYQRRIEETNLTVYLIEKGTVDKVKFNIFKRINTGGLPLSLQEIRHVLNQGVATQFIAELANSEEFKRATDNSIQDERMTDRECVLRYLAFTLMPYTKYDQDTESFDGFLNKTMKDLNNITPQKLNDLQQQFKRAMNAAYAIFNNDAFRKSFKENTPRQPINKALFESWSVNLNQLIDSQLALLEQRRDLIKQNFITLMNSDSVFNEAISQGTGNPAKVKYRFKVINNFITEFLS